LAEQRTVNPWVVGSNPTSPAMKIIDNFITEQEQRDFADYVSSQHFTYRLYRSHIFSNEADQGMAHAPLQMSHYLYEAESDKASPHLPIIRKFTKKLEAELGRVELIRAKVNLTFPYPPMMNYEHQVPHIDLQYDNGDPVDHKVLLYYINPSDGPTYFFDESHRVTDEVYPKQGRAVIFDGSQIHAASNPVKNPFRFVLNVDFKVL
jgi:hypothetical protein